MFKLTQEEIDGLPLAQFDKNIIIVDDEQKMSEAVEAMRGQSVLGFDTETRPSFKRGVSYNVALLQLSTEDTSWLIRLNKVPMSDGLANILTDSNILKAGVAIRDDVKTLQRHRMFVPGGFVDLQNMARAAGFEDFSLKKLAAHILGVRISKRQRLSNWEASELTMAQAHYAATDSWISLLIYLQMKDEVVEHERIIKIRKQHMSNQAEE